MTTDWEKVVSGPANPRRHRAGRRHDAGQNDDFDGAAAGQAGDHGQQGAALGARGGVVRGGAAAWGQFVLRGERGRRHSDHQGAAGGFVGNRISHIYGIVNGTCNYILTRMKLEQSDFAPTLAEAQKLGYAEADPATDIDGFDSMHKTGILASLAHGFWVPQGIYVEGIRAITQDGHRVRRETGLHDQVAGSGQGGASAASSARGAGQDRRRGIHPGFGVSGAGSQRPRAGQRERCL
jgi:hypothetical protein